MSWTVLFTKQAQKDAAKLAAVGLRKQAEVLLEVLRVDPFASPPRFAKLIGDLEGAYSRRINLKHRLVYSVDEQSRCVRVLRMWTHYE